MALFRENMKLIENLIIVNKYTKYNGRNNADFNIKHVNNAHNLKSLKYEILMTLKIMHT